MHAHKVIVHTCVCSRACIGACCYTWIFIHSYVYMCDLSSEPRSDLQKLRNTNPEGKSGLHNISGRCLLSQVSAMRLWFDLHCLWKPIQQKYGKSIIFKRKRKKNLEKLIYSREHLVTLWIAQRYPHHCGISSPRGSRWTLTYTSSWMCASWKRWNGALLPKYPGDMHTLLNIVYAYPWRYAESYLQGYAYLTLPTCFMEPCVLL